MNAPRIRLRPELIFSPVKSDDRIHYVIEDRLNQKFWKIGSVEYEVCSVLDGKRSVPEALEVLQQQCSLCEKAGIDKLRKIALWLIQSGLVETCHPESTKSTAATASPERPKRIFDPSFFRIPLLGADQIERFTKPMTWLISIPCLVIAATLWGLAVFIALQQSHDLWKLGQSLFVSGSEWWLLIAWLVLKAVHEFGHAVACARVGAKPNGAGIGFMFSIPTPYVDVTNLWSIENKWSRMLVSAAGMLFELTLAAIAVIVMCQVETPGLRYFCFSLASLGTLTTLAFNGNPLMRYDGYYILIDWIERPNLWQDASQAMRTCLAECLFKSPSHRSWSLALLLYGLAGYVSRTLVIATMAWGLWMAWDGVGLLIIGFFACLWLVVPRYLRAKAPKTTAHTPHRYRWQDVCPRKAMGCGIAIGGLVFCSFLPSPLQFYWPGIVDYVDPSEARTVSAGFVQEVYVHDGQGVEIGQPILRMTNPDLEIEYQLALAEWRANEEKCNAFRAQKKHSELQTEEALRDALSVKVDSLAEKVAGLTLKASRSGVLIARNSDNLPGCYLQEGYFVGLIVDPSKIEVKASIPQHAWETVARAGATSVDVCLLDGEHWRGRIRETLPRTSDVLESPALAGIYGGPIPVTRSKNKDGEEELKTESPRLQTRIDLEHQASLTNWLPHAQNATLPDPGSLCSVKLVHYNDSVFGTLSQWIFAVLHKKFDDVH